METYWRILTVKSRDLNPAKKSELYAFDSGDYDTDLVEAKEKYLRGYKFVGLSKTIYNTYGNKIFDLSKIINWSQMTKYISGGDRNGIRSNKIPKKHIEALDRLFEKELPDWWRKLKSEKTST